MGFPGPRRAYQNRTCAGGHRVIEAIRVCLAESERLGLPLIAWLDAEILERPTQKPGWNACGTK
nr:D258 [uncultured bacterium]